MIVPRGVVAPLALLVALLTTTVAFFGGIAAAPGAFFGGADAVALGPLDDALPGRGRVDVALAEVARKLPGVLDVSPEIYALTTVDGRSALVRGIDVRAFFRFEGLDPPAPSLPPGSAFVGAELARDLDLAEGDDVLIGSSLVRVAVSARVAGIVDAAGPSGDELFLPLEDARVLAGLGPDDVHLIRIRVAPGSDLADTLRAGQAAFTYTDVAISTSRVMAGEPASIRANLTNWGRVEGTKIVRVSDENGTIAEEVVTVAPRRTLPIEVSFSLNASGRRNVTINPTFPVEVLEARARFAELPSAALVDAPFEVEVERLDGGSAAGLTLEVGGTTFVTDDAGRALVVARRAGPLRLVIRDGETALGGAVLENVGVPGRPTEETPPSGVGPLLATGVPRLLDEAVGTRRPANIAVDAQNVGDAEGRFEVVLTVDGARAADREVTLAAGERATLRFSVGPLLAGAHEVAVDGSSAVLPLKVYPGRNPAGEALLEPFDAQSPEDPAARALRAGGEAYIEELLGNVALAVLALSLASAALTTAGAAAVLGRHVRENAPALGVLKALGARHEDVLSIASREAARWAALAAAIGIPSGLALAWLIDRTSLVRAFGHTVHPTFSPFLAALVLLGTVGLCVALAQTLARSLLRRSADELLRS